MFQEIPPMPKASQLLAVAVTSSALLGLPPPQALAQPAPIPRAVITAQDPPEAARRFFEAPSGQAAREVHVPGAAWLQLRFAEGGCARASASSSRVPTGRSSTSPPPSWA